MKFKLIKNILDTIEFNGKDNDYLGDVSEEIASELYSMLSELIEEDTDITEQFISQKALNIHFSRHCIGKTNKKSNKITVLYDFKNINDFSNYENQISNKCKNPNIIIGSLLDTNEVLSAFRKLFEGNVTIEFSRSCGFYNNHGDVIICLNSFATDVTDNYKDGNTINICVLSVGFKTISLYALDANYLETKFNNIIHKHSKNKNIKYLFNH